MSSNEPNQAPAVSYRQVGTKLHGSLMHGDPRIHSKNPTSRAHCNQPKQNVCSIPSKFETVLQDGPTERNGFWNRTQRFPNLNDEVPAPGSYHKPMSLIRQPTDCGSVSQLGYSIGFISKTKRFPGRVREALPGPGQYACSNLNNFQVCNQKHGTSSFAMEPTREYSQSSAQVPGPGTYACSPTFANSQSAAHSVFISKVQRAILAKNDTPPPGHYDTTPTQASKTQSAVFISKAKRSGALQESCTLGPGAYNTEEAELSLKYDGIAKVRPSAVFLKSQSRDDSSTNTPGPGTYPISGMTADDGLTSMFKSSTQREDQLEDVHRRQGMPGPAYYYPSRIHKQSHHVNVEGRWL